MRLAVFQLRHLLRLSYTLALLAMSLTAAGADARPFAPGVISTPSSGGITFSPDGRTAYFGAKTPSGSWGIMISRLIDGQWSQPETAPFSGKDVNGDPQMAPDGSGKPSQGWWPDLWYVERQGDAWREPHSLGPKVNTSEAEYSPTLSRGGKTLFFARGGIMSIPLAACDGVRPTR